MVEDQDFQRETKLADGRRKGQLMDDFHNEMAGRDVGRIARFLPETADRRGANGMNKDKHAEALNRLQLLLLNSPAYAALYRETEQALRGSQSRLEQLMERIEQMLAETKADLDTTLARAARLEDGRRVFKDKDGNVRFADGRAVDAILTASVVWKGDEPGLDEIRTKRERAERLTELQSDIAAGQAEIGTMQLRMQNEEEPVDEDEMKSMKDRAQEMTIGLEQKAKTVLETDLSASTKAAAPKPDLDTAIPKL